MAILRTLFVMCRNFPRVGADICRGVAISGGCRLGGVYLADIFRLFPLDICRLMDL